MIRVRACAYQGVRNVGFPESFAYVLHGWPQIGLFSHLNIWGIIISFG